MKKYVIATIVVAIALRVFLIGTIPPGLTNDEMNIVMNAQSILATGQNIPGVVTGIIGKTSGDLSMGIHSELGSYLIVPFVKLFGLNLISVKIPFILASIGIVITGYFLTKKLINDKAAIIALMLLAINPWLFFFGRTAYESILSSFFYLLSILLIINLRGWKKLIALFFLMAGFLSYFSAKTLIFPVSIVASVASLLLNKRKDVKQIVVLNIFVLLLIILYVLILFKTPAGARINELSLPASAQSVNSKRTMAIDNILSLPFENKVTEELRTRLYASLGEFNPNYLFLNGQPESTPALSLPDHGFMYLVDAIFVVLGLFYMARGKPKQLVILLSLIAITAIPNFLDLQGTTYSIRTVILFPILSIISAIGVYSLKNRYIRFGIVLIYLISFLNFFYIYFYRLPVERSEGWFFSQRVVSKYIQETTKQFPDKKIVLITKDPKLTFYKYLFYTGNYTDFKQIAYLNSKMANKNYKLGNVLVTDICNPKGADILIQSTTSGCPKINVGTTIKSINDAGDVYEISNDLLCYKLEKNKYPLVKNFKDLNIERFSAKDYCKNYISDSL